MARCASAMAADRCSSLHLDTSSSNAWMKYYPGLTLPSVFEQALAVGADRQAKIFGGNFERLFP